MKKAQELREKFAAMATAFQDLSRHAEQLDVAVKAKVAKAERIHSDTQAWFDHGEIDQAEGERIRLAARLAVVDARLERLEATVVLISKASAQSLSLLMDAITLLAEVVGDG